MAAMVCRICCTHIACSGDTGFVESAEMNIEELIERLERAGIDPAFNNEVIATLRERLRLIVAAYEEIDAADILQRKQQAEMESLRHELSDERRKIGVLLKEQINDRAEIERLEACCRHRDQQLAALREISNAKDAEIERLQKLSRACPRIAGMV